MPLSSTAQIFPRPLRLFQAQPRFTFNHSMLNNHIGGNLGTFRLPIVYGCVSQSVQARACGQARSHAAGLHFVFTLPCHAHLHKFDTVPASDPPPASLFDQSHRRG